MKKIIEIEEEVYCCDICDEEIGEELYSCNKCDVCKKDFCENCMKVIEIVYRRGRPKTLEICNVCFNSENEKATKIKHIFNIYENLKILMKDFED